MGWWGYGIVDGDTPQDILYDLREVLNLQANRDDDEDLDLLDSQLQANSDQTPEEAGRALFLADRELVRAMDWSAVFTQLDNGYGNDHTDLILQCMAMLYLEHELDIPEELKLQAIEASEAMKGDEADYFTNSSERRRLLDQFINGCKTNKRDGLEFGGILSSGEYLPRTLFD